MPLLPIAAGIAAVVVGWHAYWWHVDQRAQKYMKPGVEYDIDRDYANYRLVLCQIKPIGRCFSVGPWGPPVFGPRHQD